VIDLKRNYKNVLLIVLFVFILGNSFDVYAIECTGVLNPDFLDALNKYVYVPIKAVTPILLIVLTSIDFAKVVFSGKKEEMDKAKNNFMKRFVAALIIFFAPDVVKLIADFINGGDIKECLPYFK